MIAGADTRQALQAAAATELVHDGTTVRTGTELDQAIDTLALALVERVRPTEAVGIWCWNSTETLVAHLAAERAGLTRVPVDPASPVGEAERVLSAAEVACVLTDDGHDVSSVEQLRLGDWLWQAPASGQSWEPVRVEEDQPAVLIVRSATDEGLFAIPLSFANWEAHMSLAERLFRGGTYGPLPGQPRFLTVQQMMYGTGLVGTFPFLRMGLPQLILPRFDANTFIEQTARFRGTTTFMVPAMITAVVAALDGGAPKGWGMHILYGGAPFPLPDLRNALTTLGPTLTQLYGRFEGGWPITVLTEDDHRAILEGDDARGSSCGRPADGVEVALRDHESGSRELRVRSSCVSSAYADPDGWCALGDLAHMDSDGYYYLQGRLDGMINTGSFHVYPDEVVAAILAAFPHARSARVFATPHERWGEAVTAEVVWEEGAEPPDEAEFRSLMGARVAKYKTPILVNHVTSS